MNQTAKQSGQHEALGFGRSLDALHSTAELDCSVEAIDGQHCIDHLAHIYESRAEKFEAAVPFVRNGLEGGERVMYIVDESTESEILTALRDAGVDADAAVEEGQLSFHTVSETYLKGGEFDVDEALELLETSREEALEEYAGFRVTAEETWLVGNETAQEAFMTCEAHVNDFLDGEEWMALCQYNRSKLPPKVIEQVIEVHPYLVYDGIVCQNDYYTPPAEYFGPARPGRDNDRKLTTLVDRTEARVTLQTREHYERELHRIISQPDSSFEEKLDALFDLGCERFGLEIGGLAKVNPDTDRFEVEVVNSEHDHLVPGAQVDLSETYCRVPADGDSAVTDTDPVDITDPVDDGFEGNLCYDQFGVRTYLGSHLEVEGGDDRTLWFVSTESREEEFSEAERTFHHLMAQWVQYELERQEREADLRQTKNRFQTVFEDSDDGIFIIDPDADELVDANPAAAEMTGYPHEELLSRGPSDLHPDEMDRFRAFLDEVREAGSAWSEDFHCRHRDGYDIPAEITASAIMLEGSDLVLALVRHVEERKKHERYQRDLYEITADSGLEFEEKVEQMLELGRERFGLEMGGLNHLPSCDREFRLETGIGLGVGPDEEVRSNPGEGCYCRQTIAEDAPVGMTDVRDTHWVEDEIYQEFGVTSYLGTRVTSGTMPYGTLWFGSTEPREKPFSDAERSFIELMGQWIGYEIERREHNESQRELYEITADSDIESDEKIGRLLEVGCERLGLSIGMLTRKREEAFEIEQMQGIHPDLDEGTHTPRLTDNYCRRVVDTGESVSAGDAQAAGWDEDALYHEFDLQCYAGTQVTVGGDAYGTVCFTDTSPREEFVDTEQAFLDLMGQCVGYELERQQYEQDLEQTVTRLQQSNDRLKQFAYAASHDLQEPLRMVSSYLQLLENQYRDDLDADAQEYIDFAVDGADRMREMVDDLLAFSRVEQSDGSFEPIDGDAIMEQVTTNLQVQIEENDAEVTADSLPELYGDEEQVTQLFSNLVSNAIKYNESDPPHVDITAERRADYWEFAVSDDGIGFDPDKTGQIFEVFKRLHHDDEYSGTGIGLSLCQEIVDNHGGEIRVESAPGEGSTFSFTLPATRNHDV